MTKRVFWKIGDHEIEVEGDNAFIQKQLKLFFDRVGGQHLLQQAVSKDLPSKIVAGAKSGKTLSPAEYYRQKNPNGGTATLIVLGKYLDELRTTGSFTFTDTTLIPRVVRL